MNNYANESMTHPLNESMDHPLNHPIHNLRILIVEGDHALEMVREMKRRYPGVKLRVFSVASEESDDRTCLDASADTSVSRDELVQDGLPMIRVRHRERHDSSEVIPGVSGSNGQLSNDRHCQEADFTDDTEEQKVTFTLPRASGPVAFLQRPVPLLVQPAR
jgi:hypothetical protein